MGLHGGHRPRLAVDRPAPAGARDRSHPGSSGHHHARGGARPGGAAEGPGALHLRDPRAAPRWPAPLLPPVREPGPPPGRAGAEPRGARPPGRHAHARARASGSRPSPGATSTTRSAAATSVHAGMPVTDIVAGTEIALSPDYLGCPPRRRSTMPRSCSWPSPTSCPRSRRSTPTSRRSTTRSTSRPTSRPAPSRAATSASSSSPTSPPSRAGRSPARPRSPPAPSRTPASSPSSTTDRSTTSRSCRTAPTAPVDGPAARRSARTAATAGWPSGPARRACAVLPERLAVFFGQLAPAEPRRGRMILWLAPQLPQVQFVMGGTHGDAFPAHEVPDNVVFTGQVIERVKRTLLRRGRRGPQPGAARLGHQPEGHRVPRRRGTGRVDRASASGASTWSTASTCSSPNPTRWSPPSHVCSPIRRRRRPRARAGRSLAIERYDWAALGEPARPRGAARSGAPDRRPAGTPSL